jgi:hypothetical protein
MAVALRHRDLAVTKQLLNRVQIHSSLNEPARAVMEVEVCKPCHLGHTRPGEIDLQQSLAVLAEDVVLASITFALGLPRLKYLERFIVERKTASFGFVDR